jgi:hypothetical protein
MARQFMVMPLCLQWMHPTHLEQYIKLTSGAKKRKATVADKPPAEKKPKQSSIASAMSNTNLISQATVNKLITDVVVQGILPI